MSPQHDLDLANNSGAAFRSDLNLALEALQTNSSGATEITDADSKAYQFWADTGSSPAVMKMRNGADNGWITLFKLDGTSLPSSSATEIAFNDAGADLDFRVEGDTEANLFFIDAGNDRVGIGNNAPVSTLDVTGAITSKTSTAGLSNQSITFTESGSGNAYGVRLGHVSNTELAFERYDGGWAETARIDGSGRLLVGATDTQSSSSYYDDLVIKNDGASTGAGITLLANASTGFAGVVFADSTDAVNGGAVKYSNASNYLWFETGGTERMRIDSSGNVGIGNTNPSSFSAGAANLVVGGGSGTEGITIYGTTGNLYFADGTTGNEAYRGYLAYDHGNDFLDFGTAGSLRHRITPEGRATFASTAGSTGEAFNIFGATGEFRVLGNGNAYNTNNVYTSISDIKLKENIVDAPSQWDDIKAVQIRKYNFKEETGFDTHTQIGVVAQELELVSPGLVNELPDIDIDNNDLGTTTKSVAYSVLNLKAIKALQEAMERIEQLEAKVAALESA